MKDKNFLVIVNKRHHGPKALQKLLQTKYDWGMLMAIKDYIPAESNIQKFLFWRDAMDDLARNDNTRLNQIIELVEKELLSRPKLVELYGETFMI